MLSVAVTEQELSYHWLHILESESDRVILTEKPVNLSPEFASFIKWPSETTFLGSGPGEKIVSGKLFTYLVKHKILFYPYIEGNFKILVSTTVDI